MDFVTHALMGTHAANLVRPVRQRLSPYQCLLLGAVAAVFPDADYIGFIVDPLRYLAYWHQGPTHSLVLLPCWALLLGAACCAVTRRWQGFGEAVAVSALGLVSHVLLDVITAYGTQVFHPLSDRRVSLATTFIVDPLFTALVALGLAAGLGGRHHLAGLALVTLAAYVGAQAWLHRQALHMADEAVRRQIIEPGPVRAWPQPFSPFNWKLVVTQQAGYRVAHVNLAGHAALVPPLPGLDRWRAVAQAYAPPDRLVWEHRARFGDGPHTYALAQALWQRPDFAAFRDFAVHPALSAVEDGETRRCVWFTDLRYDLPVLPATFRYGHCQLRPDGPWQLFRLRYLTHDGLQALTAPKAVAR